MMRWIVGRSLGLRRLVLAAAVGIVALGVIQVGKTTVDVLPEFRPPTVEVQTEALGLSAAEVEQLITVPLEQDLLVGVPFLDEIESVSLPGLSSVVMTFEPGTDVLDARQVVQERLTQAVGIAGLPAVAKTPQMIQPLSSSSRVAMIKLTSEDLTPIEMSVLARWVIGPRLMGVPGVANVAIWGNRERQLQVLVDSQELREAGVTLNEVVRTAGNALEVSPLSYLEASKPGTGGFIDTPNQRLNIFHEQTISTPGELAQVPLETTAGPAAPDREGMTLGDVTRVVEDHQPLIGDTACGGGTRCLLLVVEKFPGANTVEVSDRIESALSVMRPGLGDMQIDSSVYRPASYIESTFDGLAWALGAGAALLLLVLVALVWDWRRIVTVAAGVTVSLSAAVLVLQARDVTVNVLVLAGLLIGLTVMIDDAVTDTDALAWQIRNHRRTGTSAPVWSTIVDTSVVLRRFAVYALLMVAVAVVPLLLLRGEADAFLPPTALAYLLAVAVSMVVALVLTPALAMTLLARGPLEGGEPPIVRRLHRSYDRTGPGLVRRTRMAVAVYAGVAAAGLVALPFVDWSMRPSLEERNVLVLVEAAPGTSLPKMTALASQAVEELEALPDVSNVNAQIGRAVMSDRAVDVNEGEIWMTVDADADYDVALASIRDTVGRYPGVTTEVTTYTDRRVRDVLDQDGSDVVVRVYGEDPDVLSAKARDLRSAIAEVDGVSRAEVMESPQETTVEVEVDLQRAQELGVKPGDVRRAAAILLGSITVGNLFEEQKVFDVVVWGAPEVRQSITDIEQLLIDTPNGGSIRLGDVAEVRSAPNDAAILHESVTRFVEVTADVSGRSVADVNDEVRTLVAAAEFPLDHHAVVLDGYAERRADVIRVITFVAAGLLMIFLLFQAAFRSWRLAALAVAMLPACSVGSLVAVLLTDGVVTLGIVAGLLAVLGISVRAVLVSIGVLLHLQRREHVEFGPGMVLSGTKDRLVPLLTTTLAAAAVMAPFAVLGGWTGLEVLQPLAVAVLGGLVTTSVVVLLVLPALYLRFGSVPDRDAWVDDLYEPAPGLEPVRG